MNSTILDMATQANLLKVENMVDCYELEYGVPVDPFTRGLMTSVIEGRDRQIAKFIADIADQLTAEINIEDNKEKQQEILTRVIDALLRG